MPTLELVLRILERLFGHKPPADLNQHRSEVAGWTSLAHLDMILELEEVFDIQLETDEIERMTSVQSIVDVLNAKLGG